MVAGRAHLTMAVVAAIILFCPATGEPQAPETTRERAEYGIVMIRAQTPKGLMNGTGIVVGLSGRDLYIATAQHVVKDENDGAAASRIDVQFRSRPSEWYPATIVDREAKGHDIAALRVLLPDGLRADQVTGMGSAPSSSLSRGSDVYAVGTPTDLTKLNATLAPDKVARVGREVITIQSVYVTSGFSGGPLLDSCGRVTGMVTNSTGREADALPIELVVDVLKGWSIPVTAMAARPDACGTAVNAAAVAAPAVTEVRRMHRDEQWRESIPVLTKMLSEQPNNPELYALRSHAYSHLELPTEALADGERAVQLAPRSAEAYLRRGEAKHGDNRFVEAIADYDRSLELDKNNGEAWGNKGSALAASDQPQKALDALNRALELQANRYEFWLVRASVHSRLKNYNAAVSDASRAIQLRSSDAQPFVERATAYANLNQFDPALDDTNQALKIKPDDPDLLGLRGNIYMLQGRRAAAREDLSHALRLKPSLTYVADLLKKLDANEKATSIEPGGGTPPGGPSTSLTYARTLDDAIAAMRNQRTSEANALLDELIRLDNSRSEAWSLKGALAMNVADDLSAAHEHYENALARGGSIYFRVAHDHGQDLPPCFGSMAISPTGVSYSADGGHRFEWPYAQIAEADLNRLYGVLIGMFHVRVQEDRRSTAFNFAAMRNSDQQVVERRVDAEMLVGFINRLRAAAR